MTDTADWTGRRVLVTGGAGLLGQETVRRLLSLGATVRATTLSERQLALAHPRLEVLRCDLREREACAALMDGIDDVIQAAGYVRGVKGRRDGPADLVMNNLLPAVNVIDAACRAGVGRFGWIGSATVYPDSDQPVREDDVLDGPPPKYAGIGWVQRYCEQLCIHFHDVFPTRFAMIRAATVYGPHERFTLEDGHVLPALIIKAVQRMDPFPVWGDGRDVRDFVHVSDVVTGLLSTMERHAVADPVNIGSGVGHSINDALGIILDHVGHRPTIRYQGDQPSMRSVRLVDTGKAKRVLGFEAVTTFESGLRRTIDWYRSTLPDARDRREGEG